MATKSSNGIGGEMGGLIRIETITPAMARGLLDRDSKNRKLKPKLAARYATEMSTGLWQLNGESIKIAVNGDVLDGQHRLQACIDSNTSFQTIVVYDLPINTFKTIDCGASRKLNDLLYLRGMENSTTVARAAAYVYNWDTAQAGKAAKQKVTGGIYRPHRNDLFAWLDTTNWKIWPDSAHAARRVRSLCPVAVACAAHYIMARISRPKADEFFEKFSSGAGFSTEDDPILRLRSKLIRDRARTIQSSPQERFLWVMTAWLSFIQNRPMARMKVPTSNIGTMREIVEEASV